MRLMDMSSSLARYRSTLIGRVWFCLRLSVAVLPALAFVMAWGAAASPSVPKPLLIVGPQMEMDAVRGGVTTPRFVLYSEGVAVFRFGGTSEKPGFRRAAVSADQMKLFQTYMDDFFLSPEFGEGFENKAAHELFISFTIEARYVSGPVEILLRNVRMEAMEYFGSQLQVSDTLAQVPVSLIRLLSLVRQIESTANAKPVALNLDEKGNPVMPGVVNTSLREDYGHTILGAAVGGTHYMQKPAPSMSPVEMPSAEAPEVRPEQPAPLVGPQSYRK